MIPLSSGKQYYQIPRDRKGDGGFQVGKENVFGEQWFHGHGVSDLQDWLHNDVMYWTLLRLHT